MTLLIAGLILFVALHMIPSVPPLRTELVANLGEKKYRAIFSALAFVSLALIIWGFSKADFQPVYQPVTWGRSMAFGLVPIAVILFAAANMPTHIRAFFRHPMLIGLFLWALAHLAANGDMKSILLFGTLGAFSVVAIVSSSIRGSQSSHDKPPRWKMDGVAIVSGTIVAGLFAKFHGTLFGMPLM
ncbi:MAG: NnrU family protein [Acidiferrobacterales bacterium]|nr:NnrU family protein [Acidiferrobacterales bacterium]